MININDIKKFLFNLSLDISEENKQNIMEEKSEKGGNNNIIGEFINLCPENLNISFFLKPPLIGLGNIGATCYMNATLQCFSNIDLLTNFFLKNKKSLINENKYDLAKEYAKLIKNLWPIKIIKKFYEPNDFKKRIGEKNPLFSGIAANDSKDLIMFILEELHKELNEPNQKDIDEKKNLDQNKQFQIVEQTNEVEEFKKFSEDYYNKNKSIIQKIFYGEQESFTHCENCKKTLYSFSIFNFLIFPLEKVRQYLTGIKNGFQYVTLEDCFDHYVSIEKMIGQNQMYCNTCKVNTDFSMWNKIYKNPEIFIIILNRGKGLEFVVPFQYPNCINLKKYINFENNDNYKNNKITEYELISVIAHIGDSSMAGHFIAYCKSPVDRKWYLFNDAIVSECDNPSNISPNSDNNKIPYVLFYQIKKNNNNDNLNKSTNGGISMNLYFKFPNEKELYIEFTGNLKFEDVIKLLFNKYEMKQMEYNYETENGIKIDISKTVKENNLKNDDKIILKK